MFSTHIRKFLKIKIFPTLTSKMSTNNSCSEEARNIFQAAVKSVKPENLINEAVEVTSESIIIQGKSFLLNKNAHIIGFGKAVLRMAIALENKLKEHLVSGIISIPEGMCKSTLIQQEVYQKPGSNIQIFEGAAKNIPDENSFQAALKIAEFVASLKETDVLFVLISGGGSALLPAPKPPLTFPEKQTVTTLLSHKGATIDELNAVRKRLSILKGGNLAQLAKPAKVISLILSDVIGDPLSIIASGPTVENIDNASLPLDIIEKYNLKSKMPKSALQILESITNEVESKNEQCFSHVSNFLIGNNQIALNAAAKAAKDMDYLPIIMTTTLCGTARDIGQQLILMTIAALEYDNTLYNKLCIMLRLSSQSSLALLDAIAESLQKGKKLCILFGGETTVKVHGTGIGGRNQELALSASIELHAKKSKHITLLSAGTDGIDGPSLAAGAIAVSSTVEVAQRKELDPYKYLNNNDSYSFFSTIDDGKWLVKIGHTGTNVMDVVILLVSYPS